MKYEKNQIVYEVGDWVTIDNLVGQLEGEIGATFPIKQLAGVYYYGDWDRVNKITGDCWEGRNLRPATQEEINKATEEIKPREWHLIKDEHMGIITGFDTEALATAHKNLHHRQQHLQIIKVREVLE